MKQFLLSKVLISCLLIVLLSINLQAQTLREKYINMISPSMRSKDNGGVLDSKIAATDGIGIIIVDDDFDNSVYNNLSNKYSILAETNMIDYILISSDTSAEEKALALTLIPMKIDGTVCDDGIAATYGETYLNNVCQGGVANGVICDDKNSLTINDIYTNGACAGIDLSGRLVFNNGILYCNGATAGETLVEGVDVSDVDDDGVVDTYYVATGIPDIRTKITTGLPANNICTSKIVNMSNLFNSSSWTNAASFNQLISSWDMSHVTNMYAMFRGATAFNNGEASGLSGKPLNWDTSSVVDMTSMFALTSSFNQLLNFNTSSVTNMRYMFNKAILFNQPVNFMTSNVFNMQSMFSGATNFNKLITFDTSNVINMSYMFYQATTFNQPINFNTSKVTDMGGMFHSAQAFNQPLNLNTSNVVNMYAMLNDAKSFNQLINFDTRNVTNMAYMFSLATSFNKPIDFNTSRVTDMYSMFYLASLFNQSLNFDTSNVADMAYMFYKAANFNQNISNWCASKIITKPLNFDYNSGFVNQTTLQPQWGTCL